MTEDQRPGAPGPTGGGDGDDAVLRLGITSYAQEALGDIVFVTLPPVGTEVAAGAAVGEVESTKSVSDVYAPVAGTVTARNDQLDSSPELINADPLGDGWLVELRPAAGVEQAWADAALLDEAQSREDTQDLERRISTLDTDILSQLDLRAPSRRVTFQGAMTMKLKSKGPWHPVHVVLLNNYLFWGKLRAQKKGSGGVDRILVLEDVSPPLPLQTFPVGMCVCMC